MYIIYYIIYNIYILYNIHIYILYKYCCLGLPRWLFASQALGRWWGWLVVVCWPRAVGLLTRLSVFVFVRVAWFRRPFLSLHFRPCDSLFWALVWVWSGLPRLSLLRVCFCLGSGRRFRRFEFVFLFWGFGRWFPALICETHSKTRGNAKLWDMFVILSVLIAGRNEFEFFLYFRL